MISNAWKYAYWINVLFNWNRHRVFTDPYTTLGIEHPVNLQSLVIEFMYSITYLVKKLMGSLWKNVIAYFGQTSTANHDSWTVSYAILMVCYAIKGSKNLKCDAKGLPYLDKFMSSLRSTSEPLLRALQHYRWEGAHRSCNKVNPKQKLFDDLLDNSKSLRPFFAISFEHQPGFIGGFPSERFTSSFSKTFQVTPFLDQDDLFSGKQKAAHPCYPATLDLEMVQEQAWFLSADTVDSLSLVPDVMTESYTVGVESTCHQTDSKRK
ncbi:uncharacterized protein LY79DRAFT_554633 [Colletotrichum navitas]|uniref:Uncharacterized protein n=1 Tax=Colletotrichum navitas TaxID=681940 RepID=A0AAD8PZI1_9PEZI|nr:uncharacterized protein LY79DRAFT_554633 [Colletotrichum navitas]KAK1590440.1 hypothetical protein LY79DRAFT_554633 [Colletotrichum navitas]